MLAWQCISGHQLTNHPLTLHTCMSSSLFLSPAHAGVGQEAVRLLHLSQSVACERRQRITTRPLASVSEITRPRVMLQVSSWCLQRPTDSRRVPSGFALQCVRRKARHTLQIYLCSPGAAYVVSSHQRLYLETLWGVLSFFFVERKASENITRRFAVLHVACD